MRIENVYQNRPVMSHKEMFTKFVWEPFSEAFHGLFSTAVLTVNFLLSGVGIFGTAVGLFDTPEVFYLTLLLLVIFDWISGVIVAIKRGEFDIRAVTRKWYHVSAYICVCLPATFMANMVIMELGAGSTFGVLAYYFHFVVYMTFSAKEFVSILKTWRLVDLFVLVYEIVRGGEYTVDSIKDFKGQVDQRYEQKRQEGERD